MTETGMILSNPYEGERKPGMVGTPLPGVQVKLVGEGKSHISELACGIPLHLDGLYHGKNASLMWCQQIMVELPLQRKSSTSSMGLQWAAFNPSTLVVQPHTHAGELAVKGGNLFQEYWEKPEATRESFTDDGYFL